VIGSLAIFDYDNDGFLDVYFLNGGSLPEPRQPLENAEESTPRNRLYRNKGNWVFEDVTNQCGLGDAQYGMGVVAGDIDNDGDVDVFVSNFGENRFFVNQGDGTFGDATNESGLDTGRRFGAGNALLDFDLDGDLDLFTASYVKFDMGRHRVRMIKGYEFAIGPKDFEPGNHFLFRNEGNGHFTDVTNEAGLASLKSPGMGVLSADFDEDGDMDLFVANDQSANFLLWNNGAGTFHDGALEGGVAFDRHGKANGNMGIEYADLNGDGRLDFFTTTYQEEMPVYYECIAPGLYQDMTNVAKIDPRLTPHVTWGIGAIDFDWDQDLDLFVSCGHFLENLHHIDDRTQVKVANVLLSNSGKGRFTNVSHQAGSALTVVESSRGAAFDDLDNDGDVDMVVLNTNARPTLGRTQVLVPHGRLIVRLVGTKSNRDAIGSTVTLRTKNGNQQKQVVIAGRGYESHFGTRLTFGLGESEADQLVVKWPSGVTEVIAPKGHDVLLIEGYSSTIEQP
jgi:enediyne biosynthesis protein E4